VRPGSVKKLKQSQSKLMRVHKPMSLVDEDTIQCVIDGKAKLWVSGFDDSAFDQSYHADNGVEQRWTTRLKIWCVDVAANVVLGDACTGC